MAEVDKIIVFPPGTEMEKVVKALAKAVGVELKPTSLCPPGKIFTMGINEWRDGRQPWRW